MADNTLTWYFNLCVSVCARLCVCISYRVCVCVWGWGCVRGCESVYECVCVHMSTRNPISKQVTYIRIIIHVSIVTISVLSKAYCHSLCMQLKALIASVVVSVDIHQHKWCNLIRGHAWSYILLYRISVRWFIIINSKLDGNLTKLSKFPYAKFKVCTSQLTVVWGLLIQ